MSTLLNIIKRIIAIIKMPHKMADKITRIQAILGKLTNNVTFPAAGWPANIVSFAQFSSDVAALVLAESAVLNKTGTAAARNAALVTVVNDLRSILTMVQNKADANPNNAQNIIENAGFDVKQIKGKVKQQNDAQNTEILGTVLLTADATGHHEWQMSKDMISITNLPGTSTAKTYVHNLTQGDVWYFRNHKVNTKKATYNWTPWIKLIVGPGGKNAGGGSLPGHAGSLGASTAQ